MHAASRTGSHALIEWKHWLVWAYGSNAQAGGVRCLSAAPCLAPTASTVLPLHPLLAAGPWGMQVRELKTSGSLVLLKTNLLGGHFAQSGLEDRLKETAFK
jgi:hypothetical protein